MKICIRCGREGHLSHACRAPIDVADTKPAQPMCDHCRHFRVPANMPPCKGCHYPERPNWEFCPPEERR